MLTPAMATDSGVKATIDLAVDDNCGSAGWYRDTADSKAPVIKNVKKGASRYEGLCALELSSETADIAKVGASFDESATALRFMLLVPSTLPTGDYPVLALTKQKATQNFNTDASLQLAKTTSGTRLKLTGSSANLDISAGWHNIELHSKAGSIALFVDGELKATATNLPSDMLVRSFAFGGNLANLGSSKIYIDSVIFEPMNPQNFDVLSIEDKAIIESLTSIDKPMQPGDANGDGRLSGADASSIVNEILKKSTGVDIFNKGVPDTNLDGRISGADYSLVTDKILGK